jgi:hypothetical protein
VHEEVRERRAERVAAKKEALLGNFYLSNKTLRKCCCFSKSTFAKFENRKTRSRFSAFINMEWLGFITTAALKLQKAIQICTSSLKYCLVFSQILAAFFSLTTLTMRSRFL